MRSAVTLSLVPQARGGPFVYWDDLAAACEQAAQLGFDGIEIFPASAEAIAINVVRPLLERHGLQLAAVGTGGGWVVHQWHFTHADAAIRSRARKFAAGIVEAAGALGAPAIVGSMQGKIEGAVSREQALGWLAKALESLSAAAAKHGQLLFYEPLNRYETNVFNRIGDAAAWLRSINAPNVRILADLFHMNIEETDLAAALKEAGELVGHVHLADSNRRAMGFGHTNARLAIEALRDLGYTGYLSAEVQPLPDSDAAARQSIRAFRELTA